MKTRSSQNFSRRSLFRSGALTAAATLAGGTTAAAAPPQTEPPPDVYTRLGVKPFINCTATYTINGGSRQLPEVIEAVAQASHYHVNIDELMEAAGKRLSELLQVDGAMVTSGAAAALTHATAACIAGTDPERMKQLPDLTGLKNEVIIPRTSQNQYFHAIRAVGVRMVEVNSLDELRAAVTPRTAMAIVLGSHFSSGVHLGLPEVVEGLKGTGVPILVDAAADYLVIPNPYLAAGAQLVAYSGGKILRGPQTAGLLLGRKDLVRAAFANSAPHHAFGRMMKVSKEEIVGMVTAVEVWVSRRNIESEYEEWKNWYAHIASRIETVDGVKTRVTKPSRGGPFPSLVVEWDPEKVGLTAGEVGAMLLEGEPRIMSHASGEGHSFLIRPVAMKPHEYKLVAERLLDVLRSGPKPKQRTVAPPAFNIAGRWDVDVKYQVGEARHMLFLETDGNKVTGTHIATRWRGEVKGTIDGDKVSLHSSIPFEGANLGFVFKGTVSAAGMTGELEPDEYPRAAWDARRHRTA